MKETETIKMSPKKQSSPISKGLLMVPKTAGCIHLGSNATLQTHRRVGSTGTTGDESGTTDEDDNIIDNDEIDMSIKLCDNNNHHHHHDNFDSYSDIATITDKIQTSPTTPPPIISTTSNGKIHRNSSDSSVYSDLGLEKLVNNNNNNNNNIDDVDWARSVVEAKEQTFSRLQDELRDAHEELKLKDEEVARLTRIRQDVEAELEDLTASLFQEAHNMVREANEKQAAAEKALKESQMKVDVLTAEVAALKTLVLTSTPSRPNPHLHPQIDTKNPRNNNDDNNGNGSTKKHRRSPSHFNLKYGRENSPPESPTKEIIHHIPCEMETKDNLEVDPDLHREFLNWRQKPCLDKDDPFIQRIYVEDIDLCLKFNCKELSNKVRYAVENGIILIEAVGDRTKAMFPKKCALLEVPRLCFYRMNIGEPDVWYSISQICRNRIIAVCDFLNYLKYIKRGLVKSSVHDVYWEIVRLRKDMVLARLGLNLSS